MRCRWRSDIAHNDAILAGRKSASLAMRSQSCVLKRTPQSGLSSDTLFRPSDLKPFLEFPNDRFCSPAWPSWFSATVLSFIIVQFKIAPNEHENVPTNLASNSLNRFRARALNERANRRSAGVLNFVYALTSNSKDCLKATSLSESDIGVQKRHLIW